MISKGFIYYILRFKDLDSEAPPLELVPVVKDFLDVFPMTFLKFLLNEK